jgi:membrane-bound lytic murein transglycosylase D
LVGRVVVQVLNHFKAMKRKAIIFSIIAMMGVQAEAIERDSTAKALSPDDPVLAMLDSLEAALHARSSRFTTDTQRLNVMKWVNDTVPRFSPQQYRERLAKLDAKTPFRLVYNEAVHKYIEAYAVRHREKVGYLLGLAELYFPLFEETLDRYNLPLEFKYLAIVESALNPRARSRSGAVGLWQFMYRTGRIYDLNTTSYLDERSDPYKATEAACQYFQYLYAMFGNWELVLAAYNGGPGTLNKAIRRSGGKRDFWELRRYLPTETQGYVPAFIAVNYVMNHANLHNIYPIAPDFLAYEVDTVMVHDRIDLKQVSEALNVPYEQVAFLNPTFRSTVVPATSKGIAITLPKQKIGLLMSNMESFIEAAQPAASHAQSATLAVVSPDKEIHRVRSGETLSAIAARYRCSVNDICAWNGIRGHIIREGQNLVLYTDPAVAAARARETQEASAPAKDGVHIVQPGDTLWHIAKQNGITVQQLKELNELGTNDQLSIGQKLKVG